VSDVLARRYLLLMRAYPEAYRRERGDEITATLLERAGDRRWPPVREVLGLLSGALQARLSPGGTLRHTWVGGLRAAVLVLLAIDLGGQVAWRLDVGSRGRIGLMLLAVGAVAFHAVLRDRPIVAVVALLGWHAAYASAGTLSWSVVIATVFLVASMAVGGRAARAPFGAGWWFAVPVAGLTLGLPQLISAGIVYDFTYRQTVIVAAIVLLAVAASLDPRAAVVAAGLLVWQGTAETVHVVWAGDNQGGGVQYVVTGTWWGGMAAVAAVGLLLGGHLLARRRATLI
jgi:hypothetical protein